MDTQTKAYFIEALDALLKVFTLEEHSEFVASLPSPDYL